MGEITNNTSVLVDVHTLRYGDAWWIDLCGKSLDSWAERHNYTLKVWGLTDIPQGYPCTKFVVVDMLREFVVGKSDLFLFVDGDVVVSGDAPEFPLLGDGPEIHILAHRTDTKAGAEYRPWIRRHYRDSLPSLDKWLYRNTGVWACNRKGAAILLESIRKPYFRGVQEQHQLNQWMFVASSLGALIVDLPHSWNMLPVEQGAAYFYHLCGRHKGGAYNQLKNQITLQTSMKTSFNIEKYRFANCGTQMPMDELHIQMLHSSVLMLGRSGLVAVEIGSYRGASTSALIEAVNIGVVEHLHIIEIKPTETLRQIMALCLYPDRITLHTCNSWETPITKADVVFIDGHHGWPALADVLVSLRWGASVISMHDTRNYSYGIRGCYGSGIGADNLKVMPDRVWFEDFATRAGTRTHRGFGVSVTKGIDISALEEIQASV